MPTTFKLLGLVLVGGIVLEWSQPSVNHFPFTYLKAFIILYFIAQFVYDAVIEPPTATL